MTDFRMKVRPAKSLPAIRSLQAELWNQADNLGDRDAGELLAEAYWTIRWLLREYLRSGLVISP